MSIRSPHQVIQLLLTWSMGNQAALDQLMPLVERERHRLAHYYMRRENAGQALQTLFAFNRAEPSALEDPRAFLCLICTVNAANPSGPGGYSSPSNEN